MPPSPWIHVMKYQHSKGKLVLKVTDDREVPCVTCSLRFPFCVVACWFGTWMDARLLDGVFARAAVQLRRLQRNCADQVLHIIRSIKLGFRWSNHLVVFLEVCWVF
jgi:hypothetical protein